MQIKTINKYCLDGKEFTSLIEVKKHVENKIGEEVFDKINKAIYIPHSDLLKLYAIICEKQTREILVKYLNVNFERLEDEYNEAEIINILDIKE